MKKNLLFFLALAMAFAFSSCSGAQQDSATNEAGTATASVFKGQAFVDDGVSSKNILQIAIGSPDHTTLVAGVQATSLENVLANNGPLTVFAPTNSAFDKLPEGVLDDLLKPENKSTLARIITYHAAPGTYKGKLLKDGMNLFMATGDNVKIEIKDGEVFANGAKILATIDAANGVVHVIDAVLLPPEK